MNYLRVTENKQDSDMNRKVIYTLLLTLLCMGFAACSDSDDYNANTAVTPYEPVPGLKMVAQVKTTNTIDGRGYSWEHNFEYDAQNRIRQINSKMIHHRAVQFNDVVRFYKCNITSQANYYYNDKDIRVEYTLSREYPEFPDWNTTEDGKDYGVFNSNGTLASFSSMDFEYSATQLRKAFAESGMMIAPARDASGNVTGHTKYLVMDAESDSVMVDRKNDFRYSSFKNRTNFDFSGYFGYWGVEQAIYANRTEYYASYQLAAFGMLGATSSYLPLSIMERDSEGKPVMENGAPKYLYGRWEFDSQECPVLFTDGTGRRTEIKYIE